ncbi:alcohol dehydrogenase [Streptomyces mirabilis]|uniref:alcohol dehydrogenase n=1 Tax=Streptomyces mirabilis TaxID=68239 RepID=UPI0033A2DECE
MVTARVLQVETAAGAFELVKREIPDPGPSQVRITVEACGVCHTDANFVNGHLPGLTFPLTPGHEIAGRIESIGAGVEGWKVGDRVAVGWYGGHCTNCHACRRGDFVHCENTKIPGLSYPGGYAEAMLVPANALAKIPDELSAVQAAPLACAGVTTYNSLRRSNARPGDLVAVLGFGGLGHLGVQFAAAMGFNVAVIARGGEKEATARSLGAHHYIDSTNQNVADALQALGGAKVVLATTANADAMTAAFDGLGRNGQLMVLGIDVEPIKVTPLQLITFSKSVHGHPSGTAADIEDTLAFAALTGIKAITEEAPLKEGQTAYDRMMANQARYRMVLTTDA